MRTLGGGTGDTLALVGLVAAALTFAAGVVALTDARRTTSAGALGVVFAVVSLFTALDLVGFALAAAGGLGCVKWRPGESAAEPVEIDVAPSSRAVASLTLAFVVGLAYFGAPLLAPAVTGATASTVGHGSITGTTASTFGDDGDDRGPSLEFPQSSPSEIGGFVVFVSGISGYGYDHTGEGYRNNFDTSQSDNVAVAELRLTNNEFLGIDKPGNIEIYNVGDPELSSKTPGDNGFYLYKNFGGEYGPGEESSLVILADDGEIKNNDNVAVGGPDDEDFAVWISEVWTGDIDADLIETPLDISSDQIKTWTCDVNDPPDDFGSISDRRAVDLGFADPGITIDPSIDTTEGDRGGLANNAHRLEAERNILNDFRFEAVDEHQSIEFSLYSPPEGNCNN